MSRPAGAVRTTAVSVLAFMVAALTGRQTVLHGSEVQLVWPAAGIAGVWIAAHAHARWVVVDCALLFLVVAGTAPLTGVGVVLGAWYGGVVVLQAVVLSLLLHRVAPALQGFADRPPDGLAGVRELGALLFAAVVSAGVGAFVGPATHVALHTSNWWVVASWVVRDTTGVLAVMPLALAVPHLLQRRGRAALTSLSGRQWLEGAVLYVVSALALWVVFGLNEDLPLPFVLVATCVWAGARFGPVVAGVHSVLLAGAVVVLTLNDDGPFAAIGPADPRTLVTQTYVLVIVLVTISLSVARRETAMLTSALRASERATLAQAELMATIVDSMGDGIGVLDDTGKILLRNPAAKRLVGAPILAEGGGIDWTRYRFHHLDGRPITPAETPMAIARETGEVVHTELIYRHPDFERRLEATATPLPEAEPPVVVVVYHDATAERRERAELAGFAGVVAHDLLNPLTVIEGWSATLAMQLAQDPPPAPAVQLQHLGRIQGAGCAS